MALSSKYLRVTTSIKSSLSRLSAGYPDLPQALIVVEVSASPITLSILSYKLTDTSYSSFLVFLLAASQALKCINAPNLSSSYLLQLS